ncbi:MAG: glycerol kinase GlpK [Chlamydiales bacterium]|nr:glycerol kinase GlpK [Chlamydiales bacterium]
MQPLILALDQGTTSSRALLIDSQLNVQAIAQKPLEQIYPKSGWVEHDPEIIWKSQILAAHSVVDLSGSSWDQIQGIAIANQRETTLIWDKKTGMPLYNAIVWQDRRTKDFCQGLDAALIKAKTGLVPDPYFSASKLRWLLDTVQPSCEVAFGTVDSFLLYRLTGIHATDPTNASRTMLYNIHTHKWDDQLLELFSIPRKILPEVMPSSGIFGYTHPGLFPKALPVAGIAGDQQAALLGQDCTKPGQIKCTYGTGCFLLEHTGSKPTVSQNHLITTVTAGKKPQYAVEGSAFIGGAAIQWLHEGLQLVKNPSEVDSLASSVTESAGVYFVPAFTGLGAPHWEPNARGTIVGLTRQTTAAHIARATLEGVAFQVADLIDAMERDTGRPIHELKVDGGCTKSDLLLQIQADILGIPLLRPKTQELTALGVALLAGQALGIWKERPPWELDKTFMPAISTARREELIEGWLNAVRCAKEWAKP